MTTELAQLQRRTLTTELAELERRTLTTELAEFDSTALHTELEQPEDTALKKAASSLELTTAQLCKTRKLSHPGGVKHQDRLTPRGSAKWHLPCHSLTLTSLSFHRFGGSSLPD